jgi:hypothetical protein
MTEILLISYFFKLNSNSETRVSNFNDIAAMSTVYQMQLNQCNRKKMKAGAPHEGALSSGRFGIRLGFGAVVARLFFFGLFGGLDVEARSNQAHFIQDAHRNG